MRQLTARRILWLTTQMLSHFDFKEKIRRLLHCTRERYYTIALTDQTSKSVSLVRAQNEPLRRIMNQYALRINKTLSQLQFCFDDDVIAEQDAVDSLDLEDGFCIDVKTRH